MSDSSSPGPANPQEPVSPRIDGPHKLGARSVDAGAGEQGAVASVLAEAGQAGAEQVQRQAAELGDHLRRRHRQLAQWEADLHAQVATWEDEQRSNRLWVQERAVELERC